MTAHPDIITPVSFGLDVTKPAMLETHTTDKVLLGIQSGVWQEPILRVRSLPRDSDEQKSAKKLLPDATWAGVFSYRTNERLLQHSGQLGVDLDDLGDVKAVITIQNAVADRFCLAPFRSIRGEDVRLLFRMPPCSPENHTIAFEQVAEYVRNTYGCKVDESGKDVSRASFDSFDNGLWFNAAALVLPIRLPDATQRVYPLNRCVSSLLYPGALAETWATWCGRNLANPAHCENGMAKTHGSLLELGMRLALPAERIRTRLTTRHIDSAPEVWSAEYARHGVSLRCKSEEYHRELQASIAGARRKNGSKVQWKNGHAGLGTRNSRLTNCQTKKFCSPFVNTAPMPRLGNSFWERVTLAWSRASVKIP